MIRNFQLVTPLFVLFAVCEGGCYVESGPAPAQPPPQVVQEAPAAAPVAEPVVVEAPPAPPAPPPAEPIPPAPSPEHYWVPAYHRWNGHAYVVERGHYERRPRPNARYVPAHWEARGRGKAWIEGRWE